MLCISSLMHLGVKKPQEIYWSYMLARGKLLALPVTTTQEMAFARLVCLSRIQKIEDVILIEEAWDSLPPSDQMLLSEHLLKDGITERTFLFAFLPLCLANAKDNEEVGLASALVVMAELVYMMNVHANLHNKGGSKCLKVDLSDLAIFLGTVKNISVLFTCMADAELQQVGDTIRLMMSSKNWSRANDEDGQAEISVGHGIKRIIRKQQVLEDALGRLTLEVKNTHHRNTSLHARHRGSTDYGSAGGARRGVPNEKQMWGEGRRVSASSQRMPQSLTPKRRSIA